MAQVPSEAVVSAILKALGRRRLVTRRAAAAAAGSVCVLLLAGGGAQHLWSVQRAADAAAWLSRARSAAKDERFDLAEYAVARATEVDSVVDGQRLDEYAEYRAHRALVPLTSVPLAAGHSLASVHDAGAKTLVVIRHDEQASFVSLPGTVHTAIPCQGFERAKACDSHRILAICERRLVVLSADGPGAPIDIEENETLHDASCSDGEVRALTTSDQNAAIVHFDLESARRRETTPVLRKGEWSNLSLCSSAVTDAAGVPQGERGVVIIRDGARLQGGKSAVYAQFGPNERVMTTVYHDDDCTRFIAFWQPLMPAEPSKRQGWSLYDWEAPRNERQLPDSIRKLVALPRESQFYAVYLDSNAALAALPVTDAILSDITPRVIATNVRSFAVMGTAPFTTTASLEGENLVVRRDGAPFARYPLAFGAQRDHTQPQASAAADASVRASATAVAVEHSNRVGVWRRASVVKPTRLPSSKEVAAALQLSPAELEQFAAVAAAGAER
ncbi:MAG: hypothetical protein QM756_02340 [Polyangiaceae bacterium]